MTHDAAEWDVFSRWFRSRPTPRRPAEARPIGASPTTGDEPGVADPDDRGPVFAGGGAVLLSPSHWEKAGWGIALLLTLAG